jgi:hypothetical protein
MKPKKRQKLCHNCEADVDLDVIVCPFCAADLREDKGGARPVHSSYVKATELETPLYPAYSKISSQDRAAEPVEDPARLEARSKDWVAILLCTLGAQLFVLGLFMLLFSHKGALVLRWDSDYWFLYCLFAGPVLYLGYRSLSKDVP